MSCPSSTTVESTPTTPSAGWPFWGQGRFWEIRDTKFTVRQTSAEAATPRDETSTEIVNVRQAIFGV